MKILFIQTIASTTYAPLVRQQMSSTEKESKSSRHALGEFIREARIKKGFSLGTVSQYLGLKTDSIISHYESGFRSIPCQYLAEIADLLDIKLDQMVKLKIKIESEKIMKKVYEKKNVQ